MLSESARMSSAVEAAFRVQAPNSLPRAIKIVALDAPGEAVVRRLAHNAWTGATFLTASVMSGVGADDPRFSTEGWLTDLAGRPHALASTVEASDLIVLIAGPGGRAGAASAVGAECRDKAVMATAFIVGAADASDAALSKTLAQLRPWSLMVVIAGADDYIGDILTALRA